MDNTQVTWTQKTKDTPLPLHVYRYKDGGDKEKPSNTPYTGCCMMKLTPR